MTTPPAELEWLRDFIEHKAVFRSPPGQLLLTSASSGANRWQFFLPVATLDPEFQARMAALFWRRFAATYTERQFQLCACDSGGVPVACALQAYADRPVPLIVLKKAPKDYGLHNWVEGVVDPRRPVLLVDDVVGGRRTLTQAGERLRGFGLEVLGGFAVAAVKDGAMTFKLGGEERPIAVMVTADAFARTYEQYFAKNGKIPQFDGVLA